LNLCPAIRSNRTTSSSISSSSFCIFYYYVGIKNNYVHLRKITYMYVIDFQEAFQKKHYIHIYMCKSKKILSMTLHRLCNDILCVFPESPNIKTPFTHTKVHTLYD
jgi:hypothetical protein